MKFRFLPLALALCATPLAFAQTPKSYEVPPGALAAEDVDFLRTADTANIDQMTFSQRITGNSKTSVRSLGENVLKAHRKADSALRLLASNKHVDLDHEMSPRAKDEADELVRKDVPVDLVYTQNLVRDSRDLIALYERARDTSPDGDIRVYADTMLPALVSNQRQAEDTLARANESVRR